MELSKDLRYSLPPDVNPYRISQHVKIRSGIDSPVGESHLLLAEGELLVLTRTKSTAEFEVIRVPTTASPHMQEDDDVLLLPQETGTVRLPIPSAQLGPVAFILQRLQAERPRSPDESYEPPTGDAGPRRLGPLEPDEPLSADVTHPGALQTHLIQALRNRQWSRASGIIHRLAESSLLFSAEAEDLLEVLRAIRDHELDEAFFRADLADTPMFSAKDAVLAGISDLLAAASNPVWAIAARLASVDEQDESTLAALFRVLGKDFNREEHVDEVMDAFERERSVTIGKRIVEQRTKPLWRELRARLAGRRGGHAMALRELRLLAERFPGEVTIDAAYLRWLHEAKQSDRCQQRLIRCMDEYENPSERIRILQVAASAGIPLHAVASRVRQLQQAGRQDMLLQQWIAELPLIRKRHIPTLAVATVAVGLLGCIGAAYWVLG